MLGPPSQLWIMSECLMENPLSYPSKSHTRAWWRHQLFTAGRKGKLSHKVSVPEKNSNGKKDCADISLKAPSRVFFFTFCHLFCAPRAELLPIIWTEFIYRCHHSGHIWVTHFYKQEDFYAYKPCLSGDCKPKQSCCENLSLELPRGVLCIARSIETIYFELPCSTSDSHQ